MAPSIRLINWDLAGTYYHIDAMHIGNQLIEARDLRE